MLSDEFRPNKFEDIVGNEARIKRIRELVLRYKKDSQKIPNIALFGPPGVGKTSIAWVIAVTLFGEEMAKTRFIEYNASDDRGIDVVRDQIKMHSMSGLQGIIFLDECDAMTSAAQNALRKIMEDSKNMTFILSANFRDRIIGAIQSRCAIYELSILSSEEILKALIGICNKKKFNISAEEAQEALVEITLESEGDLRKAINLLETIIDRDGKVTAESTQGLGKSELVDEAFSQALKGDFVTAKDSIVDAYLLFGFSYTKIIRQLNKCIDEMEDLEKKVALFKSLARLEQATRTNCDPVIQLVSFIADVWTVRHLEV